MIAYLAYLISSISIATECYGYELEDHYYNEEADACMVDDINYACTQTPDGVCGNFKEFHTGDYSENAYRCENEDQVYYQTFWTDGEHFFSIWNYDKNGEAIAHYEHSSYGLYCCDGVETDSKKYGVYYVCDRIPLDSGDSGQDSSPQPPDTCGCAAAPSPWWALPFALPLLRRRSTAPPR